MSVAVTYQERMALIKKIAVRRDKLAKVKKQGKALLSQVANTRSYQPETQQDLDADQEIYWTDGRKYANEYYGEIFQETTKLDNDWD